MLRIDRLDAELIGALTRDARTGVVELAGLLGVARNTVQARLRRLHDEGLTSGFMPRLDLAAVGISVQAFAALALEQGRLDDIVAQLTAMPHVLEVCDRIQVLRLGKRVATYPARDTSVETLVGAMTGALDGREGAA